MDEVWSHLESIDGYRETLKNVEGLLCCFIVFEFSGLLILGGRKKKKKLTSVTWGDNNNKIVVAFLQDFDMQNEFILVHGRIYD